MLALAVRWPDYLYTPAFTDEAREVTRAALIAQGRLQTLTNVDPYISSLFNYLLAGLFRLFGPQLELSRMFVLTVGCLTVVATWLLGRAWGGSLAGLIAGALLATNPVHVLVNSHIAYSNCITPLFTTLGVWALTRAIEGRRDREIERQRDGKMSGSLHLSISPSLHLCLAAVLFGLAMLTHPAALVLLPGCALYVLWRGRELLWTRGMALAIAVFLVVYSPLIAYNISTGFKSLEVVDQTRSVDPNARVLDAGIYLRNLGGYSMMLLRSAAGAIDQRAGPLAFLMDPLVASWLVLGLLALIALARRGNPLPLLLVPSSLLAAAFFSASSFEPVIPGRYVMPMVIVLYGAAAAMAAGRGRQAAADYLTTVPRAATACRLATAALALALVALPLRALAGYDERRPFDNHALLAAEAAIEAARGSDETVLIDAALANRRGGIGARLDELVTMVLTVRGIPSREVDVEAELKTAAAGVGTLAALDGDTATRLRDRYSLTRLAPLLSHPERFDQPRHAVYRVTSGP